MKISLIPKAKPREEIVFTPTKTFISLLGILIFVFFLFFVLQVYSIFQKLTLNSIEEEIKKIEQKRDQSLEEEIEKTSLLIDKIKPLIDEHLDLKKVLDFIEKNTYKEIQYTDFSFDRKDNVLTLTGVTFRPYPLFVQNEIFKHSPKIKKVELLNIAFGQKGWQFRFKLYLRPEITRYVEYEPNK